MDFIQKIWLQYKNVLAYLFFGGFTTIINLIVFGILNYYIPTLYWLSNVIAWFISVLFAYITNKIWVFNSTTDTNKQLFREALSFFCFRLLSLGIDELIMVIGISWVGGNAIIVKLIDQIIIVLLNWFFSKLFI
ncbi:GtrA family protein, partial [Lactiplantibacillus mudanjiangensis]|uniref:GtrA family protein n=1 Tax=Lactiplantibacillus mudanjiangensis TaxID=1296538 RepID=UPI00102FC838